ncbi:ATP-binding protein [Sphingomonas sp. PR090111-T3T-6A]|uniref:ATP-binding protein n=1 Tax=Sphingomonas sp. PR090111-T3T-6A TaxID=685778 RepID=UPI00036DB38A|nr:ATP-binding protein [Sphingomonas sp. PR090111-T3T-6A]
MRRSISLFAITGLLPVVVLGGIVGTTTFRSQRDAIEQQARACVTFTAVLLARELDADRRAARALSSSTAFDGAWNEEAVRALVARAIEADGRWRSIRVSDPSGRPLIDVPANPEAGDADSLARAVATKRPIVGGVVTEPDGSQAFAVHAPIVRDGRIVRVLTLMVPSRSLNELLETQPLAAGWRSGIIDGSGDIVANAGFDWRRVGQPANPAVIAAQRKGVLNLYRFRRLDGSLAVGMWAPVAGTDWAVYLSAPAHDYSGPLRHAIALLAGAAIVSLLLFALLARLLIVELRHYRARERGELQRQRMEALGRLTGGVAHDFNNLLTPVMGGLDLLRRRVPDDPKAQRYIETAMASAERARTLIGRLLAFSRRQALAPRNIDVGALLTGLSDLIRQSVTAQVRLEWSIADRLPPVLVDPAQLELAILNLAINARDAMPNGGAITISAQRATEAETLDLPAKDYVSIAVTDTGIGMDEATARQAIDPFFTTKAMGKGTGLGLSMVHGFAAQSGGMLHIASRFGVGTVAKIVLPAGTGEPVGEEARPEVARLTRRRILVVDDDQAVRASTAEMLTAAGHDVIEAASVDQALAILDEMPDMDAVVTDYLMPQRTGADLIREMRKRRPETPVLLVTGYASVAGDVPANVTRLAKPFRADELLVGLARIFGRGALA